MYNNNGNNENNQRNNNNKLMKWQWNDNVVTKKK
jgi:hypothetical protein